MRESITIERSREQAQTVTRTQGCCPECGPETCEPVAVTVAAQPETKVSAQQCCEPDCGPETCG